MEKEVLIADSDRQLLRHASAGLHHARCRIVAETSPDSAMAFARQRQPHVIIVPVGLLESWARRAPRQLERIQARCSLIVTAHRKDQTWRWRRWAERGCEVLLKPVVHFWQLYAAVRSAINEAPFLPHRDLPATKRRLGPSSDKSRRVQAA